MAKYDALEAYLRESGKPWLRLTPTQIEIIIGGPLPPSASKYLDPRDGRCWWTNENPETTAHVQCVAWQRAGYDAKPDPKDRCVIFIRRRPQQP